MGLGDILGSISPAFGMGSGKGLFGKLPLNAIGQSGLGGILGMLLSHGSHGGGEEATAPAADTSSIYQGIDPMFTQGPDPSASMGPRFGNFGGQRYFGGQNPIGQNAIGRFIGGMF